MIERFSPHLEILPPPQRALWSQLAPASEMGFALYGGTAIALYLGHRQSVDFDFFSARALDRGALEKALPMLSGARVLQSQPDTLTVLVEQPGGAVKLSFFGELHFGRVGEPVLTADGVLQVASPLDLLATKAKVLMQRIELKDYRDIAALIRAGMSLAEGLGAAQTLYGTAFQPSECLKALTWFDEGDLDELKLIERQVLIDAVVAVDPIPAVPRRAAELVVDAREIERGRTADARWTGDFDLER